VGLLKIALLFLLALFPLLELVRIQFPFAISITLNDVLVMFVIFGWIISCGLNLRNIFKTYLAKRIALFSLVLFGSLIFNIGNLNTHELFVAFLYLGRWVCYAAVYMIVGGLKTDFKKKIKRGMAYGGGAVVVLGFLQYIFYSDLRNLYYLGWDEHLYRMFSSFLDPNYAGAFFVLYFLFLLPRFLSEKKGKAWSLCIFFLCLSILAIFLTYSRSAFIMFFVSLFVFSFLTKKKNLFFAVLLAFLLGVFFIKPYFSIENINLFRTASNEARIDSAQNALTIIKDYPFFGVGFNAYRYAQIRYGFREKETSFLSHADAGTDNSFLFILATAGIIGFFAFIALWISVLKKAYDSYKERKDLWDAVVIASILGIGVDSLFINSFFYPPLLLWIWFLLGIKDYT